MFGFSKKHCKKRNLSVIDFLHENTIQKNDLAVVLVDMQQCFIDRLNSGEADRIIPNQTEVIQFCVNHDVPIIVLEYKSCGETISNLSQAMEHARKLVTIRKCEDDGFDDTPLDAVLKSMAVKKLFFMGINGDACVLATAASAKNNGYTVITGKDFISSSGSKDHGISWYKKNCTVL